MRVTPCRIFLLCYIYLYIKTHRKQQKTTTWNDKEKNDEREGIYICSPFPTFFFVYLHRQLKIEKKKMLPDEKNSLFRIFFSFSSSLIKQ